jgi:hypothetical protein
MKSDEHVRVVMYRFLDSWWGRGTKLWLFAGAAGIGSTVVHLQRIIQVDARRIFKEKEISIQHSQNLVNRS